MPKGNYLEDYVAAFLQCGGFYVEKSLVDSGETPVMELDIVAWKPDDQPPRHELFEVKGGDWGFSDVFKVLGWKTYLDPRGVNSAYLIAPAGSRAEKVIEFTRDKCSEIGVSLMAHSDLPALELSLKEHGLASAVPNELDHAMWRFSFWLERQMQRVVTISRRSQKDNKGPDEVHSYQELIRNGLVQARDVRERLASLYKAHFDHQLLARSVAAELDGGDWNPHDPPQGTHWNDALYKCEHPLVHAAMYYQHRARLDILKGAVEFALLKKHDALPPERKIKFLGIEAPVDFLPANFHNAVKNLQTINGFEKIAVLWQSFLWKWGGFFLSDNEVEEKSALADEVGMSAKAVDDAIAIYDTLFPMPGGWFQKMQGTNILKLFPCQFRGIGGRYRCGRLGVSDPKDAFGTMPYQYLISNLISWNNATVALLRYGTSDGIESGS